MKVKKFIAASQIKTRQIFYYQTPIYPLKFNEKLVIAGG